MLKTRDWIYLDLEKTGCTFIRDKLLKIYTEDFFEETTKHSLQEYTSTVPKIISIREPESYYFSLWSYGIDHKGGFFDLIKLFYPEKLRIFYSKKNKECFSYFLDFVLNYPFRYPKNKFSKNDLRNYLITKININLKKYSRNYFNYFDNYKFEKDIEWIPSSCDLYTSRILSMLIPKNDVYVFSDKLKADLSYDNLETNLVNHIPEVILRTSSLNADFYKYFKMGKIDFLNLPEGWQSIFPLNSMPINISSLSFNKSSNFDINNYLTTYHKDLIKTKSNLANFLLNKAKKLLAE